MPKKKSTPSKSKSVKHQTLKLSPHEHSQQKVVMMVIIAAGVGLVLGMFLVNQVMTPMLGY